MIEAKHFTDSEFACHCCGVNHIKQELVTALDALRELAGVPITVLSGYRCEAHNKACGGKPHSEHPLGKAADIRIKGKSLQEMYDLAKQIPAFMGIGVYDQEFIHVDVRSYKARWARVRGIDYAISKLVNP